MTPNLPPQPAASHPAPTPGATPIPEATIARLPAYLRVLVELADQGVERVSSTSLAQAVGVQPALLRRDLSHFGSYGTRGVGYPVGVLVREIGEHVGTGTTWPVLLVGVGNMGRALAEHLTALDQSFELVALVDASPAVVGSRVAGVQVDDQADLEAVVARTLPRMAVVTTPASAAQQVVDRITAAGVRSILNLAPASLTVPPDVTLRRVDLLQELHILAFHEARRTGATPHHAPVGHEWPGTAQEQPQ